MLLPRGGQVCQYYEKCPFLNTGTCEHAHSACKIINGTICVWSLPFVNDCRHADAECPAHKDRKCLFRHGTQRKNNNKLAALVPCPTSDVATTTTKSTVHSIESTTATALTLMVNGHTIEIDASQPPTTIKIVKPLPVEVSGSAGIAEELVECHGESMGTSVASMGVSEEPMGFPEELMDFIEEPMGSSGSAEGDVGTEGHHSVSDGELC